MSIQNTRRTVFRCTVPYFSNYFEIILSITLVFRVKLFQKKLISKGGEYEMTSVLEYHRGNDRSPKVFNFIFKIFFDGRSSSEDYSNDFQPIILDHFFRIKINNNLNNLLKSQDQSSQILNHQWDIFCYFKQKSLKVHF